MIEEVEDDEIRVFLLEYVEFQYNKITRVGNSANFCSLDMRVFNQFSNYQVICKLCQSKNILDERDTQD